jgi:hypothetical protein
MPAEKSMKLLPIMSPLFNLREICKHLSLLEDHLNNPRKRCHDCIRKHFLTIEAFFEEAVSLDKKFEYGEHLDGKAQAIRDLQGIWIDSKDKKDHDREYLTISQELRAMRKGFAPICFDVRKMASLDRPNAICPHGFSMRGASIDREASIRSFIREIPIVGGLIRLLSDGRTADLVLADKLTALKQGLFQKLYSSQKVVTPAYLQEFSRQGKKTILSDMRSYALDIKGDKVILFKKFLREFLNKDINTELFKNSHHEKMITASFDAFKKTINKLPEGTEVRFKSFPSADEILILTDPANLLFTLAPSDQPVNPGDAVTKWENEANDLYLTRRSPSIKNVPLEAAVSIEKTTIEGITCVVVQNAAKHLATIFDPAHLKNYIASTIRAGHYTRVKEQQEKLLQKERSAHLSEGNMRNKSASFSTSVRMLKFFARKFRWSSELLNLFMERRPYRDIQHNFCENLGFSTIKFLADNPSLTPKALKAYLEDQIDSFNKAMDSFQADNEALAPITINELTHRSNPQGSLGAFLSLLRGGSPEKATRKHLKRLSYTQLEVIKSKVTDPTILGYVSDEIASRVGERAYAGIAVPKLTLADCSPSVTSTFKNYANTTLKPNFERVIAQLDKKMVGEEVRFTFFPTSNTETLIVKSSTKDTVTFYVVLKDYMLDEVVKIRDEVTLSYEKETADYPAHVKLTNLKGAVLYTTFVPTYLAPIFLGASDVDTLTLKRTPLPSKKAFLTTATKTKLENEDDKIADLVKPAPKNKPPRYDLANRVISEDDPDLGGLGGGHQGDRDLSMKSNRAAHLVNRYAAEKKKS